ncbi:hypothetical protein K438DRAFT_1857395 [Mycena galopus ATCC 62051]|nr:hypothetical protein K438DRAFT_1857395 [Mycena galopus ATCC 62051]
MWPTAVQARARYYGLCIVTSALAPLSLLHPVVRIPDSDFRASDSVPRIPDIGLAPPDFRNFRTTSGCPPPHSSGRPTSLGHSPGSSAPHPPRLWSGPVSCPYSRTRAGCSVLRDLRNLRAMSVLSSWFLKSTDLSPGYFPVFRLLRWNLPLGHMSCYVRNCIVT